MVCGMQMLSLLSFLTLFLQAFAGSHPSHQKHQSIMVDSSGEISDSSKLMRSHEDTLSASLEEAERDQMLPSASDLVHKAMDLGFGTTGMALDDYPFACICDAEGACLGDPAETGCKMRAGMPNGAISSYGSFGLLCSLCSLLGIGLELL